MSDRDDPYTEAIADELSGWIADELSGWPIGSGYYGTSVGSFEAREMAQRLLDTDGAVMAIIRRVRRDAAADAWEEGLAAAVAHLLRQEDADAAGQGHLVPDPRNPYLDKADQ